MILAMIATLRVLTFTIFWSKTSSFAPFVFFQIETQH